MRWEHYFLSGHCGFLYCLYFLVLSEHRGIGGVGHFWDLGSSLFISLGLGLGYLLLCSVLYFEHPL